MTIRRTAYGEGTKPTWVDRFGVWLSAVQIRRHVRPGQNSRIGDFGCGYAARLSRGFAGSADSITFVDVSLSPELHSLPGSRLITGTLPEALRTLPSNSFDLILCLSVLEHLSEPQMALLEMHRLLDSGGTLLVNVPNWRGKWFLEFSAFRLGLSPALEIDDHKMYYDPMDLWPMLVRAGFAPSRIQCFKHKFGLNTFAVCRKEKQHAN